MFVLMCIDALIVHGLFSVILLLVLFKFESFDINVQSYKYIYRRGTVVSIKSRNALGNKFVNKYSLDDDQRLSLLVIYCM